MEYEEILEKLAPCGLSCEKCFANSEGDVRKSSTKLKELLGSFTSYAERFSSFIPVLKNYSAFEELLNFFAQANCDSCRKGTCIHPNCGVIGCYQKKGVDFCFQCDEFPCNKTNFAPEHRNRWVQTNNRMREVGVILYFEETKDLPRYR